MSRISVTNETLKEAGVDLDQFNERQLNRMRACLRDRVQSANNLDRAIKLFKQDMKWVMGFGTDPKGMLKRRLDSAIQQRACPEAVVFERCIEVAVDDLFGGMMSNAINAHEYFLGPVFKFHCGLLGINPDWAKEVVAASMKAAGWDWSEKRGEIINVRSHSRKARKKKNGSLDGQGTCYH